MIIYKKYNDDLKDYKIAKGFFEGWPNPPSEETHRKILKNSYLSVVAIDDESDAIVGFINVISDGILSAYIPLLEVVPKYRNRGIGKDLMELVLESTRDLYMVDLSCDENLVKFYEGFNMHKGRAMLVRNYDMQSGKQD